MLSALKRLLDPPLVVVRTREAAEYVADIHRALERDVDFVVQAGRGGWMIARRRKNGTFHSWVHE
jgi:hypothetical protein